MEAVQLIAAEEIASEETQVKSWRETSMKEAGLTGTKCECPALKGQKGRRLKDDSDSDSDSGDGNWRKVSKKDKKKQKKGKKCRKGKKDKKCRRGKKGRKCR